MLRHELGEVRSTCHSTKSSPLRLGSSRAATCRRLARGGVGLVVRPAQERTVPVEQYLGGVGGRPLVAGRTRDQAANARAMACCGDAT